MICSFKSGHRIDKNWLVEQLTLGRSIYSIAESVDCDHLIVLRCLRDFDLMSLYRSLYPHRLPDPFDKRKLRLSLSKDKLTNYINLSVSAIEIAIILGASEISVYKLIREYGLSDLYSKNKSIRNRRRPKHRPKVTKEWMIEHINKLYDYEEMAVLALSSRSVMYKLIGSYDLFDLYWSLKKHRECKTYR